MRGVLPIRSALVRSRVTFHSACSAGPCVEVRASRMKRERGRKKEKKKTCHLGKSPADFLIKRSGARRRRREAGGPGRQERSERVTEEKRLLFRRRSDKTLCGRGVGARADLKWNEVHFSISLALKVAQRPAANCQRKWFLPSLFSSFLPFFRFLTVLAPVSFSFHHRKFFTIPTNKKKQNK